MAARAGRAGLKLLLDELYSKAIAQQLRRRGWDVVAVKEVEGRDGAPDAEVLAWAQEEGRALITEDISDYMPLHLAYLAREFEHYGLVFTSPWRFPRGKRATMGRLVRGLDRFLEETAPQLSGSRSFLLWLD